MEPAIDTLPADFAQTVSARSARLALFEGSFTRTWGELEEDCGRVLSAIRDLPQNQIFRWYHPEVRVALPVALALLHRSIVWEWDPSTPPLPSDIVQGRTSPRTLLQRLTHELRPRDPACRVAGQDLHHQQLRGWAHSLALPEYEVLATWEPFWAALAATLTGTPIRVAPALAPASGWWTDAKTVDALGLAAPRLAGFGKLTRTISPSRTILGPLQQVWVAGIPQSQLALSQRGITVAQIILPTGVNSGYPVAG